jgi:hypothetical protein
MTVITSSPTQFGKLLELQRGLLDQSITQTIHADVNGQVLRNIREITHAQLTGQKEMLEQKEALKVEKETLKVNKEMSNSLKEIQEAQADRGEMAEAISNIANTVKTFDSLKDKLQNMGKSFRQKFGSVSALKTTALKAVNVGGFLDKKIAERDFVQQQRKLGSEKSDKELREDFATRNKVAKDIKGNEAELDKFKKETGLNDKQIAGTKEGQRLLAKRESLSDAFAKTDMRAGLVAKAESAGTPLSNKEQNDAVNVSEEEMEAARRDEAQSDLLTKIEKNTAALGGDKAKGAEPSGEGGGGLLGGIGAGLKALGGGLAGLGKGAGKGIQALLRGIAMGLAAFANPATLIGLGAVTLAVMGIGKALEMAAPGIEAFGNAAEKIISGISEGIIGIINSITDAIERLGEVDGMNLIQVGAGLLAVSAGMAAFGAANAVAGVGNLVGGLLSKVSGQKSPVDQIIALGEQGVNIEKAGIGVEKLGTGLKAFSSIDPDKIKAIAALPTDKIAAMGLAMGNANAVSSQSAANDSARTAANGGSGGGNTAVNAPTTNISNTKQVVQLPVRNQEQTMNRYVRTRFA